MYSKFESDGKLNPEFEAGEFELPLASITTYLPTPLTPRYLRGEGRGGGGGGGVVMRIGREALTYSNPCTPL